MLGQDPMNKGKELVVESCETAEDQGRREERKTSYGEEWGVSPGSCTKYLKEL